MPSTRGKEKQGVNSFERGVTGLKKERKKKRKERKRRGEDEDTLIIWNNMLCFKVECNISCRPDESKPMWWLLSSGK